MLDIFIFLGDTYYYVWGAKKAAILNESDNQYSRLLTVEEITALGVTIVWSGGDLDYEPNDEVGSSTTPYDTHGGEHRGESSLYCPRQTP